MTPLRTRMIRELELQRMAPSTVSNYVKSVEELARYYGRSPAKISREEVRSYLHYLITQKMLGFSTCNGKIAAFNFLYRVVLRRDFQLNDIASAVFYTINEKRRNNDFIFHNYLKEIRGPKPPSHYDVDRSATTPEAFSFLQIRVSSVST